ncbi:hypothetical protein [Streptomyces sp. IBSBF 2435]|uniref:hypothetical protein n=1 Tax=Streptomyces sp. IBSBF 2435 TaxID=2903531 RepID=UPI002FDC0B1D
MARPPASVWRTGRRLLHLVVAIPCYLAFLWAAWDSKKQTFADKIVHTVVIKP